MEVILSIIPLLAMFVGNQGMFPLIAHGRRRSNKLVRKKTQDHESMGGLVKRKMKRSLSIW
jgi:hypothetical protein